MIELEANNQLLEIDHSNLRFNITYRSPYFGYLTSFIFNFLIPNTDINRRTLNFPLRLNRINKTRVNMPGRIISDGIELASGTWEAASAGEDFIELSFTFITDELVAALKSKTLPDIFDEEVAPEDMIAHVEATVLKTWPETDHQFPSVYAPDFYQGENEAFLGVINNFEGSFVNDEFNVNTIVPMLYLFSIIKRIFEFAGYQVTGDIFADAMLSKAIVMNNHGLDKLISIAFYGNQSGPFSTESETGFIIIWDFFNDLGGFYDPETGKYHIAYAGTYEFEGNIKHYKLALATYTLEVVRKVGEFESILFSITDIYDFNAEAETLISFSTEIDNSLGEIYVRVSVGTEGVGVDNSNFNITSPDNVKINAFQESFNYKNHVPVIDSIEFLKMFFEEYQVFPIFDRKTKKVELVYFSQMLASKPQQDLTQGMVRNTEKVKQNDYKGLNISFDFDKETLFIPDQINGEVETYFDLPSEVLSYNVILVNTLNAYLYHFYNETDDIWEWLHMADVNPVYEDGLKEKMIVLKFAPLLMRNKDNRINMPRSLPYFSGSGTSHAYQMNNEFPLRIMFYAGYTESYVDNLSKYPFAGISKLNSEGDEVLPYNYNASEVASRFYAQTIHWLKNRLEVEFERRFTALELKQLSMGNQQMLLDSYIILEEIFANVDPDLSKAKIKGWTSV